MKLEPADIHDLKPVIEAVVVEVLKQIEHDRECLHGRLAVSELELAPMIGVPRHVLADHRRRLQAEIGRIIGRKIGKCLFYSRDEALELAGMGNGHMPGEEAR